MSRAFVKEKDDELPEEFPERSISPHANFVSARGLRLIEERVRALEAERDLAKAADDTANLARINRDLRYWQQRRSTARLVTPDAASAKIRFGMRITLQSQDGGTREFTLVGEDEADPAQGLISWVSPLAQQLLGREASDEVVFNGQRMEIVRIEPDTQT